MNKQNAELLVMCSKAFATKERQQQSYADVGRLLEVNEKEVKRKESLQKARKARK